MKVESFDCCVRITADSHATPFYLSIDRGSTTPTHSCHYNFDLAIERDRGLSDREDHLHAATFEVTLNPGESLTFVASTDPQPNLDGAEALKLRHNQEQKLINLWKLDSPLERLRQRPETINHS
jgi:Glycogen debranching enzyme N terminal